MLGFSSGELLILAMVALVVVGPQDLPRLLREFGRLTARAREMARVFRSGFDQMLHEAEMQEMAKSMPTIHAPSPTSAVPPTQPEPDAPASSPDTISHQP